MSQTLVEKVRELLKDRDSLTIQLDVKKTRVDQFSGRKYDDGTYHYYAAQRKETLVRDKDNTKEKLDRTNQKLDAESLLPEIEKCAENEKSNIETANILNKIIAGQSEISPTTSGRFIQLPTEGIVSLRSSHDSHCSGESQYLEFAHLLKDSHKDFNVHAGLMLEKVVAGPRQRLPRETAEDQKIRVDAMKNMPFSDAVFDWGVIYDNADLETGIVEVLFINSVEKLPDGIGNYVRHVEYAAVSEMGLKRNSGPTFWRLFKEKHEDVVSCTVSSCVNKFITNLWGGMEGTMPMYSAEICSQYYNITGIQLHKFVRNINALDYTVVPYIWINFSHMKYKAFLKTSPHVGQRWSSHELSIALVLRDEFNKKSNPDIFPDDPQQFPLFCVDRKPDYRGTWYVSKDFIESGTIRVKSEYAVHVTGCWVKFRTRGHHIEAEEWVEDTLRKIRFKVCNKEVDGKMHNIMLGVRYMNKVPVLFYAAKSRRILQILHDRKPGVGRKRRSSFANNSILMAGVNYKKQKIIAER